MNYIRISSALVNIALLVVFRILSGNESIHEKECILPKENTKNHENGKCIVFTKCNFELINQTYHLVSDEVMLLPTTYAKKFDDTDCPRYYELPGYEYFNQYQSDNGYGYCEVPFNLGCSQLMYNVITGSSSAEHAGILYKMRDYNSVVDYLSYAKTDEHGTNCPTKKDMVCVDYSSIYDVPIITLTITIILLIFVNICDCIYRKYSYKLVDKNNEETQKLQGVV